MIGVVSCVDRIDKEKWKELIDWSGTATWFQTWEAYGFFAGLEEMFEPFVYGVVSGNRLMGVCVGYVTRENNKLKQLLTRRAIIIGGPVLADDVNDEELEALLKAVKEGLNRKSIYIETRNFNDYSKWKGVFEKCGFEYVPHLNFHIDTSSEDVVAANFGKSRKRDIKTSLRDGAEAVDVPTLDDVRGFYEILKDLYKTKVKTPLFPFLFFERLYASGLGIYRLVRYQGKIIGGTLCVGLNGVAMYEWFACGMDGVYKNIYPSTIATYSGIEYAVKNGYPRFDMMGAGAPGDGGYGVRDFKAKFGGVLVEHGRFLCVCDKVLYCIGKIGVSILKKKR